MAAQKPMTLDDRLLQEIYPEDTQIFGGKQLIDTHAAPFVGYMPDLHGNAEAYGAFLNSLKEKRANDDEHVYAVMGDVEDKTFAGQVAQQYGITSVEQEVNQYVLSKLETTQSQQTFALAKNIEQVGGDQQYLGLIEQQYGSEMAEQERSKLESLLTQENLGALNQEVQEVYNTNQEELQQLQEQVELRNMVFDWAMKAYQLEPIVQTMLSYAKEELTEDGEIKTRHLYGLSNHDDLQSHFYIAGRLREELGEEVASELYGNAMDYDGAITFGEGDDAFRWAYSPNISMGHGYDEMTKGTQQKLMVNPHLYYDHQASVYDPTPETLSEVSENVESKEYARISNNLEGKLDAMLLHDGFGSKGLEKGEVPPVNNAGVYRIIQEFANTNDSGLATVAYGHTHSPLQEVDEGWGLDKHRDYAMIVGKNGVEHLSMSAPYQKMDISQFDQKRFEELYQGFMNQIIKAYESANDNSGLPYERQSA